MDPARNPYAPGAGSPPPFLAGREELVELGRISLAKARRGLPARGFVLVGLRGVGKTVILNKVQDWADGEGFETAFFEATEDAALLRHLIPHLRRILLRLDRMAAVNAIVRRGIRVLKGFVGRARVKYGELDISIDVDAEEGTADSGDLLIDLPALFLAIGEAAEARKAAVAIIVDEIQYLSGEELEALITATHRANQKRLPLILIGAGLPQVLVKMGDTRWYAERLLEFPRVDALDSEDAFRAIAAPAAEVGVAFDRAALEEINRVTQGYPYFLQEWGFFSWNLAPSSPIGVDVVRAAGPAAIKRLDESFFRMRLDRMTPTERRYMRAMAELGPGPHRSGEIAAVYGAKVTTVAPLRSTLIAKGMIYSPEHGNTAFTVPLFDEFLRREMPAMGPA